MTRRQLGALAAGGLFGVGLVVSGMTDPRNVIGFLDFSSRWNPSLIAVMAGAVAVHASLLALLARAAGGRGARLLPPRSTPSIGRSSWDPRCSASAGASPATARAPRLSRWASAPGPRSLRRGDDCRHHRRRPGAPPAGSSIGLS